MARRHAAVLERLADTSIPWAFDAAASRSADAMAALCAGGAEPPERHTFPE